LIQSNIKVVVASKEPSMVVEQVNMVQEEDAERSSRSSGSSSRERRCRISSDDESNSSCRAPEHEEELPADDNTHGDDDAVQQKNNNKRSCSIVAAVVEEETKDSEQGSEALRGGAPPRNKKKRSCLAAVVEREEEEEEKKDEANNSVSVDMKIKDDDTNRKRMLCLGMSLVNLRQLVEEEKTNRSPASPGEQRNVKDGIQSALEENSWIAAVRAVRAGIMTECYGRDLARCMATEAACNVRISTVSIQLGSSLHDERHVSCDCNNGKELCRKLRPLGPFAVVALDYFWQPTSAFERHWRDGFYRCTLPSLAKSGIVEQTGSIYLPFNPSAFKRVLTYRDDILPYYSISFIWKENMHENPIYKGTQRIDDVRDQKTLGKAWDQEEKYCRFTRRQACAGMEDGFITNAELRRYSDRLEDFECIRFIKLAVVSKDCAINSSGRILDKHGAPIVL